jgi:hypothetical protein
MKITTNRQLRAFEAIDGENVRARLSWAEAERRGLRVSWETEVVHFDRKTNTPVAEEATDGSTYPMDDRFANVGRVKATERTIPWSEALELRLVASGEKAEDELAVVAFSSGSKTPEHLVRAEE